MTPEEAKQIINKNESQRVELKESFAQTKPAIESLCAFAHSLGGTVFFGVNRRGIILGVSIVDGKLEQFANDLRQNTDPPLQPIIESLEIQEGTIVSVEVDQAAPDELIGAYGRYFVRVGPTSHRLSTSEIRSRVLSGIRDSIGEQQRPMFEVENGGFGNTPTEFEPGWKIRHILGDYVPFLYWRVRSPRLRMNWRSARGSALHRTRFVHVFKKDEPPEQDDQIGLDEIGFEIRFPWHDRWRHELH